jgi:hypothetical protein
MAHLACLFPQDPASSDTLNDVIGNTHLSLFYGTVDQFVIHKYLVSTHHDNTPSLSTGIYCCSSANYCHRDLISILGLSEILNRVPAVSTASKGTLVIVPGITSERALVQYLLVSHRIISMHHFYVSSSCFNRVDRNTFNMFLKVI